MLIKDKNMIKKIILNTFLLTTLITPHAALPAITAHDVNACASIAVGTTCLAIGAFISCMMAISQGEEVNELTVIAPSVIGTGAGLYLISCGASHIMNRIKG